MSGRSPYPLCAHIADKSSIFGFRSAEEEEKVRSPLRPSPHHAPLLLLTRTLRL